jgi:hypothetical protein
MYRGRKGRDQIDPPVMRQFAANTVRPQQTISAISCGRWPPKAVESWSLTSLREKLIKIGAKPQPRPLRQLSNGRCEGVRQTFAAILTLIAPLRASPAPP